MEGGRILTVGVSDDVAGDLTNWQTTAVPDDESALALLEDERDYDAVIVATEDAAPLLTLIVSVLPEAVIVYLADEDKTTPSLPTSEHLYCLPTNCKGTTITSVIQLAFRAEEKARQRDIDRFCSLGLGLKSIGRVGSVEDQLHVLLELVADALIADGAKLFLGEKLDELILSEALGKDCEDCNDTCCYEWAKEAAEHVKVQNIVSPISKTRALALPLIVGGKLGGAIVIIRRMPKSVFDEREVAMARTFCTAIALAMEQNRALVEQEKSWTQLVLRLSNLARLDKQASLSLFAATVQQDNGYSLKVMTKLLDLMVLKEEQEEQRNNLVVLKGECRRIRSALDELYNHLPSQSDEIKTLRLNQIVDDAMALVELTVPLSKVEIRRSLSTTMPSIEGREGELQLLIVNTVLRALECLSGAGELELRTDKSDTHLSFSVQWWRTVEPQEQTNVLDEKESLESLALGMGVVTSIVERYDGSLSVGPREKKSGSYEVRLPISKKEIASVDGDKIEPSQDFSRARLRVLVVDDERDILYYFRALLEKRVQKVATAKNIDVAKTLLSKESFDVMFLDSRMPGADGLAFFNDHLRVKYPELPVVLFTGSEDPRDPIISEAGFYGILAKPCRGREIFSVLETILREQGGRSGPKGAL